MTGLKPLRVAPLIPAWAGNDCGLLSACATRLVPSESRTLTTRRRTFFLRNRRNLWLRWFFSIPAGIRLQLLKLTTAEYADYEETI